MNENVIKTIVYLNISSTIVYFNLKKPFPNLSSENLNRALVSHH